MSHDLFELGCELLQHHLERAQFERELERSRDAEAALTTDDELREAALRETMTDWEERQQWEADMASAERAEE